MYRHPLLLSKGPGEEQNSREGVWPCMIQDQPPWPSQTMSMAKQQLWGAQAQSQIPAAPHTHKSWGSDHRCSTMKHVDGPASLLGTDRQPCRTGERPGRWNLRLLGPNLNPATHLACNLRQVPDPSESWISYLHKEGLDLITGTHHSSPILGACGLWLKDGPLRQERRRPLPRPLPSQRDSISPTHTTPYPPATGSTIGHLRAAAPATFKPKAPGSLECGCRLELLAKGGGPHLQALLGDLDALPPPTQLPHYTLLEKALLARHGARVETKHQMQPLQVTVHPDIPISAWGHSGADHGVGKAPRYRLGK